MGLLLLCTRTHRIYGGVGGVGLQGAGYDVWSKFASGGISLAVGAVECFDLTIDKTEAERAELIAINLNVAKIMHHIFRCNHKIRSIDL